MAWHGTGWGRDTGQAGPAGGSGRCAASQVAYDTGDYYHSIAWLEEAVGLFRRSYGSWNPEDRSSLEDALDHLAFSYFMVRPQVPSPSPRCLVEPTHGQEDAHGLSAPPIQAGNISHALSLSREFLHYGTWGKLRCSRRRGEVLGCPRHLCMAPTSFTPFLAPTWGNSPGTNGRQGG